MDFKIVQNSAWCTAVKAATLVTISPIFGEIEAVYPLEGFLPDLWAVSGNVHRLAERTSWLKP